MIWLILGAVVIVILLFLSRARPSSANEGERWPFQPKRPLNEREQVAYHALVAALPESIVLSQVAVSQLLTAKGKGQQAWRNKINRLVADFVVCDRSFRVLAVIELDGRSHDHPSSDERDQRKEKALTDAGLRFFRWNAAQLPGKDEMRAMLLPQALPSGTR